MFNMSIEKQLEPVSGGLFYNYETERLEYDDGSIVGPYTFYLPTWRPSLFFFWRRHERFLNPQYFPTEKTRDAVRDWLRKTFPGVKFESFDDRNPGVSHPSYFVRVKIGDQDAGEYSLGLLAMRLQTSGPAWAKVMFRDELRSAGFSI